MTRVGRPVPAGGARVALPAERGSDRRGAPPGARVLMADRVFAMPDLGEGVEEGEIVAWLVAEGDDVALNQPLVEVETAKATVEIPSPYTRKRSRRCTGASGRGGGRLAPGDVPRRRRPGCRVEDASSEPAAAPAGASPTASGSATGQVAALAVRLEDRAWTSRRSRAAGRAVAAVDDVEAVGTERAAEPPRGTASGSPSPRSAERSRAGWSRRPRSPGHDVPNGGRHRAGAARREREVSPLPIVVAALCRTIGSHPLLNASWSDDAIVTHRAVHVGIAVDTDRGLIVPVVRDAGTRSIRISPPRSAASRWPRARARSIEEVAGATISVSNTGSYGSEAGTPLLNPPSAVTIALGVIAPRALVAGRRRRGATGVHVQPDVRPSRPRRRRRRTRPHRPRRPPPGRCRPRRTAAITFACDEDRVPAAVGD